MPPRRQLRWVPWPRNRGQGTRFIAQLQSALQINGIAMLRNPPNILAVISDEQDEVELARVDVPVDFAPADEWVRWKAMTRQLRRDPLSAACCPEVVEFRPHWSDAGEPNLCGFELQAGDVSAEWDLLYFAGAISLARSQAAQGNAQLGGKLTVRVQARERERAARPRSASPALPVARRCIPRLEHDESATPIVVDSAVVDAACTEAEANCQCEVGGLLLGRHVVDPADGRLAVEVTDLVRANQAECDISRFRLTHEAWTELRRQIAARSLAPEIGIVGWWHSHPVKNFCLKCPAERRDKCALRGRFFSQADARVHRTFLRASSAGLLVTVAETQTHVDVFGWAEGEVAWRSWHQRRADGAIEPRRPPSGGAGAAEPAAEGDDCHAT